MQPFESHLRTLNNVFLKSINICITFPLRQLIKSKCQTFYQKITSRQLLWLILTVWQQHFDWKRVEGGGSAWVSQWLQGPTPDFGSSGGLRVPVSSSSGFLSLFFCPSQACGHSSTPRKNQRTKQTNNPALNANIIKKPRI